VIDRFPGYWTFFQWLPVMLQRLALAAVDQPALLPLRILSLFFGAILLTGIWAIANWAGGRKTALIAVVLTSFSLPFILSAHLARYDIMAAALGFAAIAFHLVRRSRGLFTGFLTGLCLAVALEIHPFSIIFGFPLLALYWVESHGGFVRRKDFWAFAATVALGLAAYAWLHIFRYFDTYVTLNRIVYLPTHVPPLLTFSVRTLLSSALQTAMLLFLINPLSFPVLIWAIFDVAQSHSARWNRVLVVAIALISGLVFMINNKFVYYLILMSPAFDVVVALFLAKRTTQIGRARAATTITNLVLLALVAGNLFLNVLPLKADSGSAFRVVQTRVENAIRPGEVIIGPPTYWFGLHEHKYYSWEQLVYLRRYSPKLGLQEALESLHPDVLIWDRHLDSFVTDSLGTTLYDGKLTLPRTHLQDFVLRHALLVDDFDGGQAGRIRIYRILWNN
jgi:4-amino-4-deoxy-L-arabinose transferase-like glycosyltransferase